MFLFFNNISFLNPEFFGLLLLLPAIGAWYFFKRKQHYPTLKMPNLDSISELSSWRGKLRGILPILRALAFIMLVIAIARPQETLKEEEIKAEGIDIFLVLDVSYSMLAKDLTPDRMEASKRVATDFVERRKHDRIGLALFGGEAFTQCPLTTDHRVVKEFLAGTKAGILGQGTAIGMGLSSAVNHIKDSESESKIIILLTDGVSNTGYIQPMTAAEIAVEFGAKVYTIGVGTQGEALYPINPASTGRLRYQPVKVEIDEVLLRKISEMSGGKYFRATDDKSLENIYAEIDRLEKTEIEVTTIKRHSEEFYGFAFMGLLFLIFEILLRYTVFRTIP